MKRWLISTKETLQWADVDNGEQVTFLTDKIAKKGDIIVVYKASPHRSISHLFVVKSSTRNEYARTEKERFKLEIHQKFKIPNPVTYHDMLENSIMDGWLKRFPDFMYEIPGSSWIKLSELILKKNPELKGSNCIDLVDETVSSDRTLEDIIDLVGEYDREETICTICNEAVTEEVLINPILKCLGWDTSNPCEVRREYSIGRKKVDYALRKNKTNLIFIEVKNFNSKLTLENKDQIIDYCLLKKVKWGILTNGKEWYFYNVVYGKPDVIGTHELIKKINLIKDDKSLVITQFERFLSKERFN
mgnify:CR=1 FL=1